MFPSKQFQWWVIILPHKRYRMPFHIRLKLVINCDCIASAVVKSIRIEIELNILWSNFWWTLIDGKKKEQIFKCSANTQAAFSLNLRQIKCYPNCNIRVQNGFNDYPWYNIKVHAACVQRFLHSKNSHTTDGSVWAAAYADLFIQIRFPSMFRSAWSHINAVEASHTSYGIFKSLNWSSLTDSMKYICM